MLKHLKLLTVYVALSTTVLGATASPMERRAEALEPQVLDRKATFGGGSGHAGSFNPEEQLRRSEPLSSSHFIEAREPINWGGRGGAPRPESVQGRGAPTLNAREAQDDKDEPDLSQKLAVNQTRQVQKGKDEDGARNQEGALGQSVQGEHQI